MSDYEARRAALKQRYLGKDDGARPALATGGVDHLALICTDIEKTIDFYTEVMGMRLVKLVPNRDDPTSTHIFLDMGGGNLLAFFDFPEHGPAPTVRGIGSMHHVALKAAPADYRSLLERLDEKGIAYSVHGGRERGSVYMRDPDNILVEVTTGY
jgi:catechol 2,3-dioxygenase-like lactoylglutathione lyase family enzyme